MDELEIRPIRGVSTLGFVDEIPAKGFILEDIEEFRDIEFKP